MQKIKDFFNRKPIKYTLKTLKAVFITLIIAFILVVVLQRFSGNKISFFKYRMFTVITGSMKPKYDVGDVLIAKSTPPADIKVGDAITYLGNRNDFAGKVVTHEVIKIDQTPDGKYYFHAKGLANLVEDPIVSEDQVYGVVTYRTWLLSNIYKIVSTTLGFFLFIVIPLMIIITSEIVSSLLEKEDNRRQQ